MTIDLFERYASLDPAKAPGIQPEWSEIVPVLSPAIEWSEPDMHTQQHIPTQPQKESQSRPRVLVATAAIALIVIVGAIVVLTGSEDPAPPSGPDASSTITPSEALAISSSYYEAANAGDVERLMALYAADAVLTDSYTPEKRTPADEEMQFVWNAAQGTKLRNSGCTVTPNEPGTSLNVFCQGETHNAISQALGAPPVPVDIRMVVTSEGITTIHEQYGFPDHTETQIPFMEWMQTQNPSDASRVDFGVWSTVNEATEFGQLVAQYAGEWATHLATNGCIFHVECVLLTDRTPSETIKAYISAYNAHQIDSVMAFFTDESVITDHPFAAMMSGFSAIRGLQLQDLASAAKQNAYIVSNIETTGDTVTWDHTWRNSAGQKYCKQGNSAVIKGGTILTWTWPPENDTSCP